MEKLSHVANNIGLSCWAEFKPDYHFCRVRAVPGQTDGGNLNKVEKSKNLTGSLINMGKPGKADQQKEAAVKKEGQSSKSETDHERSKAIKPEPQENLKLESRGRKMSAQQEQLLKKLQRGPTLISPPAQRVKEQRPKGRTIRKAHYDPHEVRYNCLHGFLPKGKNPRLSILARSFMPGTIRLASFSGAWGEKRGNPGAAAAERFQVWRSEQNQHHEQRSSKVR